MKHKPQDALWVFWWTHNPGRPYPCAISSYRRADCILKVEAELGQPWKKLYRQGGRIVRCNIVPAGSGT